MKTVKSLDELTRFYAGPVEAGKGAKVGNSQKREAAPLAMPTAVPASHDSLLQALQHLTSPQVTVVVDTAQIAQVLAAHEKEPLEEWDVRVVERDANGQMKRLHFKQLK